MKKHTARLIALLLLIQLWLPAATAWADSETFSVEQKTFAVYLDDVESRLDDAYPLYFVNGANDLPYVELSEFAGFLNKFKHDYVKANEYALSCRTEGSTLWYERENGYSLEFDFDKGRIVFDDYDSFIGSKSDGTLIDLVSEKDYDESGESQLFRRDLKASFERYGDEITLDLKAYGIPMLAKDGKYYLPFQTMNDFLLSPADYISFLFNGKALILDTGSNLIDAETGEITELHDLFYDVPSGERSEALAEYSYNELCLLLDSLYGLKEPHEIESFSKIFWQIGFDEALRDIDPEEADSALYQFITYYIDDLHSSFNGVSHLCDEIDVLEMTGMQERRYEDHYQTYYNARRQFYPDGVPGYEEVGNTAFVTFDSFESNFYSQAFYQALETGELPDDTVGLLIYANAQIHREDSPIENVVIDLSVNRGGALDAAAAVLAWYLGDASFSVKNTFSGAMANSVYRVDLDLDHEFDEWDTVTDKNLYCLISPVSFSCGNLVPAALKASQKVTLIGKTSGGGSCAVQTLTTAYGSRFQISGPYRMSFLKNGSFYDIDQGVEPDCYIDRLYNYYDRQALTDYINSLL